MTKLGIIAAKGGLAQELIEYAANNEGAFIVALQGEADPEVVAKLDHVWIKLGEVGKAIDAMRAANVKGIVIVGSLHKPDLLSMKVDWVGAKLLATIVKDKLFGDNKLLSSLTNFLEKEGFELIGVHELLKHLVVEAGIFTKLKPNAQDLSDIELGIRVVAVLGDLDIGQGSIVQNGIVLGVEAIEGTDSLIKRCGELKRSNSGGVLVKFSKPSQELRVDLPTIGIETIKNLKMSGFKGIVIQAQKTIFLDQDKVIEYANMHNMFVGAQ
jgi:DUF1009 family protein